MTDIKSVLADAEDLLKQAANTTGERASELSDKALALLKQAKEKASDVQVVVVEKSKQAARVTDDVAWRRRIEDGIESVLRDFADRARKAGDALAQGRDPYSAVEATDV